MTTMAAIDDLRERATSWLTEAIQERIVDEEHPGVICCGCGTRGIDAPIQHDDDCPYLLIRDLLAVVDRLQKENDAHHEWHRKGGQRGAAVRNERLTPERRREIASLGGKARMQKRKGATS